MAPPRGYQRRTTLTPRPALRKGRGSSEAALALRNQYQEAVLNHTLQVGTPLTWTEIIDFLKTTAQTVVGETETQRHKPWFSGRRNEIKTLNQNISIAKRSCNARRGMRETRGPTLRHTGKNRRPALPLKNTNDAKKRLFIQGENLGTT